MPTTQRRSSVIKALLPALLLLLTEAVQASYSWQFGLGIGSNHEDRVTDVAFDPNDQYIYAVGYSENNNALNTGLVYSESDQGFLIKFSETGSAIWQLQVGADGRETVESVAVGSDGTIYLTGTFTETCEFFHSNGNQASTVLNSSGDEDVFIAAYSPNGFLLWAIKVGGGGSQSAPRLSVDGSGISLVGQSVGAFNMSGTTATTANSNSLIALSSDRHVFICRYTLMGAVLWVKEGYTSGTGDDSIGTVAADGTNIYISLLGAGATLNWINGGANLVPIASHNGGGTKDAFLSAFTIGGAYLWSTSITDPTTDDHSTLAITTGCEAVYISGEVGPGSQFANGATHPATATSDAFFVAKLDPTNSGTISWIHFGSTDGNDEFVGCDISYGSGDLLQVTGRFRGTVSYQSRTISASSQSDGFLLTAKATTGFPLELEAINGSNTQESWSVASGPLGGVAVGGEFLGNVVANSTIISTNGGVDGYIALAQMGVRAIGLQNPTYWTPPSQVCIGQGPFDLGALLVPPHMGAGVSIVSSNAVVNPANTLGAINDLAARFTNSTSWLVIDLNDTLPAGEALQMRFRKSTATTSGSVYLRLSTSMNATGPFQAVDSMSSSNAWYMWSSKLLPANARYVKITQKVGSDNAEVDGLRFAFGSYPSGYWSGTGVTGSSWSPTAIGATPLTYTVGTGTCARSTTHSVNVVGAPSPGTISANALMICPGGSVTFTTTGSTSGTLNWVQSTDGWATSTIFATNATSATLSIVTAVTKVKLVATSADCSSASSNELTVIPQDTVEPVLICPAGPLLAYVNINCKTAVPDVLALVSATDACGPVSIVQSPASGTTITASTTVTITAKDQSNNSTTCAVLISVTDTIAPQFTLCPNDIIISTTGPTALVSYPTPSALDNCSSVTINRISGPASGASFPMGSTNVTWRAYDDSGNTALCDFLVTVVPNTAPVINCPNDIVAYTAPGTCTAEVAYPVPVGTDDSGGTTAKTDHTGHVSGSMYPIGSYVQEYTMSANDGGFATCSFHIEVIDTVPPVISCPASISTNSASNQCSSLVTYGDPSLSDNCMGCAPTNIPQHALVGTFQGHTYYRSWTADEWNVANTAALSVPNGHLVTIGSPSEQAWLVNALYAQLGGNLPFWMGLTDATTEGTWTWVTGEPLDWSTWNTGNGQPDNVGNADHAYLNDPGTSFWDDAPSTTLLPWIIEAECLPALEITRTSGPASGSTFPVGITPVVFQAIDHGGNISSCTFNVAVNDVTPPALSCPSNIEL
ncbi:MAG: HYR domain-containing protein, partial [Flavobacteriales bacterium]|nr:HYR domain-containing protein [Flavobacteriales bacterium]